MPFSRFLAFFSENDYKEAVYALASTILECEFPMKVEGIAMPSVAALHKGLGPRCPSLEELFGLQPDEAKRLSLSQPTAALGRYLNSVGFLSDVTSQKVVGLVRFDVLIEYTIALSEELDRYQGIHKDKKVIHSLTPEDKANIRKLARTLPDIVRAEAIEGCTEHDTAAAIMWLKILIGTHYPHLESMIEGVAFANTSEDTMSSVFGRVGNSVVYGHFLPKLLDLVELMIEYVNTIEAEHPAIIPAETHQMAAEPQTFGKRILTMLYALDWHIRRLIDGDRFIGFSGRLGGATGNMATHYAAYPDIDWRGFAKRFIEAQWLTYEEMTYQSVTYAVEASIFTELGNIMTTLIKLCEDLMAMAGCSNQLLLKIKRPGTTASSVMPTKQNFWNTEGAVKMLKKTRALLFHLAESLPDFPREGNMGRSFLMREFGSDMMAAFIALDRIKREIIGDMRTRGTMLSVANIARYFNLYPGLAGSSIQTVLKREEIAGDAYRQIEAIAINPDGSYADMQQFTEGLERVMEGNNLPVSVREELRRLVDPANNIGDADELATKWSVELRGRIAGYRQLLQRYAEPLIPDNVLVN